jgi:sRNA-binding carbon storage regulator CsrA
MLVLEREAGQRIILTLPDKRSIVVAFLKMRNGSGRIGIQAPGDVLILREELTDETRAETR